MPTVSIVRDELFSLLEQQFTEEEFDELCFEYGLELDDVVTEKPTLGSRALSAGLDVKEEVMYKVEVPANRYDLLCVEGLAQALRIFLGKDARAPEYVLRVPGSGSGVTMRVDASTNGIRPYVVCAVLRDIAMDERVYKSLIDLQDKLHHNICRRRTLVAIGTHDLDKVAGTQLTYTAETPEDICFVPLARDEPVDAHQLMTIYETDAQLKKYLPIIRHQPRYPVIRDADRHVLSLPPIINGDRTKVTLDTRNLLIECTATDRTKASIVLNILVATFSKYCERAFEVEPVDVVYAPGHMIHSTCSSSSSSSSPVDANGGMDVNGVGNGRQTHAGDEDDDGGLVVRTPDFGRPEIGTSVHDVLRMTGIPELSGDDVVRLLGRMQLPARVLSGGSGSGEGDGERVVVEVPILRPDVLHAVDVACDVAVAYGFNRIPEREVRTVTVGRQQPLNHLSDLVRREGFAQAGYTEVLTWVTVSDAENFGLLRRTQPHHRAQAVHIANPKTLEFEQCRTSLLPGLLKTLRENRKSKVPIRLFEVGDVVVKCATSDADVGAANRRRAAAVYCGTAAGFEIVQGLLESVLRVVGVHRTLDADGDAASNPNEQPADHQKKNSSHALGWSLDERACDDDAFFPGRRANIVYHGKTIGSCGWVHPEVLKNFSLSYPCSAFEFDLQVFV